MNNKITPIHPDAQSQGKHKILPILIAVLATAIIVGGGVFALQELRTGREIEKLQQEIFELKKIAQTQSETDDMDNWKTYTDEENGFTFKYPSYLNNKNGSGDNVTFTDSKVARTIVIDINNSNSDPINNYNTEIDGVQAYRFMEGAWECAASIYRMALKNSKQVELSFVPCKEGDLNTTEFLNIDEQNRILSTFKFLPTSADSGEPISTADWKTYRNEEYGFEVRYPENLETGFGGVGEFVFSIKKPKVSIFINPVFGLEGTRKIGTKMYDFVTQEVVADILIDDTQYCPAPELCNSKYILADANHRGKSFVIFSSFNQEDAITEKLVDQILSTFKFLD